MPKKAVSITLDESNLLWLKGRARVRAGGSLSEAVDQLIAEARAGTLGAAEPPRSVVGTIEVPDDAVLTAASVDLGSVFTATLDRPVFMEETRAAMRSAKSSRKK